MTCNHRRESGNEPPPGARRRHREALMLTVLVLVLPGTAAAQAVLTDDAYTRNVGNSDANFGTHPHLVLSPASSVYLKFDLVSGMPASTPGSAVAKATLLLYVSGVTAAGRLDVHALADAWDERSITSATAPPPGMLVGITDPVDVPHSDRFLAVDVTSLVQQWLGDDGLGANGLPNHGIALTSRDRTRVTFDSKENPQTGHEAQLQIQLRRSLDAVASVNAEAPLSVTSPTTTPIISLGLVPVGKGGTGLTSTGAAGNFLRSAGGVWSSVPLTAGDLPDLGDSYIRNATAPQAGANFAIGGTGAAGVFDAAQQFNLAGSRILSNAGFGNLFAGEGTGSVNAGFGGAFFGYQAGLSNTTARLNSFFGYRAGLSTTEGCCNSFFGNDAGIGNVTGRSNVFAGGSAGARNSSGSFNTFIGDVSGWNFSSNVGNTTGMLNTFAGYATGWSNTAGSNITLIGAQSNVGADNLSFATALGAGAVVSASNTVVLGRSADTVRVPGALNVAGSFAATVLDAATQFNLGGAPVMASTVNTLSIGWDAGAGGDGNLFVGQSAGHANTTGGVNTFVGQLAGQSNTTGTFNTFVGNRAGGSVTTACCNNFFGNDAGVSTTDGTLNSFFGGSAGFNNTTGFGNAFFGDRTGQNNTTGNSNAFFGVFAGFGNTTGGNNTLLGHFANVGAGDLSFATAIGSGATVHTSNTVVLGRSGDTVQVPGQGIILTSPNGAICRLLSIDNAGTLSLAVVACP